MLWQYPNASINLKPQFPLPLFQATHIHVKGMGNLNFAWLGWGI